MIDFESVSFSYKNHKSNGIWPFRKNSPAVEILKSVDFHIEANSCFGLIGPNGAGKSTVVKIGLGMLECDSGMVSYMGRPRPKLADESWRESLGLVSGAASRLFPSLSLEEHIEFFRSVYRSFDQDGFRKALVQYDLEKRLGHKPNSVSFGERIKFEILLTLACRPRVLMLDEPSVGLDPIAVSSVRELLRNAFTDSGMTGILTSHNLGDITAICKTGAFLQAGSLTGFFKSTETDSDALDSTYRELFSEKNQQEAST